MTSYDSTWLNSMYDNRARVPGFAILEPTLVVKPHAYKTNRGDLRLPSGFNATYSQLRYGIPIHRGGWALRSADRRPRPDQRIRALCR